MNGLNRIPSQSTTQILYLTPIVRETSVTKKRSPHFWISKNFSYFKFHYKPTTTGIKDNFPWKACAIGLLRNMLYVLTNKTMRKLLRVMRRDYCWWIGEVRTLAGGTEGYRDGVGRQAQFFHPTGLTFDHKRKIVYVTDQVSFLCLFWTILHLLSVVWPVKEIHDREAKI